MTKAPKHPLIYVRTRATGPRPAVVGTGLDVMTLGATVRQNNGSIAEAADYLELPADLIEAAMAYYADYRAEIDAALQKRDEARERAGQFSRELDELGAPPE